eukprot:Sspe_Gene.89817::Locus_61499_Transcript_1_1_Confidence_1.000_Length_1690::g.89817::m.89817
MHCGDTEIDVPYCSPPSDDEEGVEFCGGSLGSKGVYPMYTDDLPARPSAPPRQHAVAHRPGDPVVVTGLLKDSCYNERHGIVLGTRSDGAVLVEIQGCPRPLPIAQHNLRQRTDSTSSARDTTLELCLLSWVPALTAAATLVMLMALSIALLPFGILVFRHVAAAGRFAAHTTLRLLLHPTPEIPAQLPAMGSASHTVSCMAFVVAVNPMLSLSNLLCAVALLPCIAISRLFMAERRTPVSAVLSPLCKAHRAVAVTFLAQHGAPPPPPPPPPTPPPIETCMDEGGGSAQPPRHLVGEGPEGGTASSSSSGGASPYSVWLQRRERTQEEVAALDKFTYAYRKLYQKAPRLQDITIAPSKEPGKGPRHFICIGDVVDEGNRLKLVKAYKAAFSMMYVHIIDGDEQQRLGGTDYSAMYS